MTYWLHYSAARLSGATIKAAGYPGVIRYIGAGSTGKRTDAAEYRSHLAAGLTVLLVCQGTTTDGDRGFEGGADMARAALADIKVRAPGYSGPIFFTNDRTVLPNASTWRAYLDGAASVLGKGRVGAYGFGNAMKAAIGHATYFWQAGRRADVNPHVHIWQDNNTQVRVGGITCDRNLILKPITTVQEDDMPLTSAEIEKIADAAALKVWGYMNKAAGDTVDMHEQLQLAGWNYKGANDDRDMHQVLKDTESAAKSAK